MDAWKDFFIAKAGAAAVLAGLIFVGISMNLQKLLEKRLISRAAWISLLTLVEVFIVSSFMLIPQQPLAVLGGEVGMVGLLCWTVMTIMTFSQIGRSPLEGFIEARAWYIKVLLVLLSQLITLPYVIAGIMLLFQQENGVYWLTPGILSALPYSLYMGWVLTVEVNR